MASIVVAAVSKKTDAIPRVFQAACESAGLAVALVCTFQMKEMANEASKHASLSRIAAESARRIWQALESDKSCLTSDKSMDSQRGVLKAMKLYLERDVQEMDTLISKWRAAFSA
jgi:hypothetical protein